jgi:hypothetical protein
MAEVVLDANILVAQLDANDSLHAAAVDLVGRLEGAGHRPVLLDVLVAGGDLGRGSARARTEEQPA